MHLLKRDVSSSGAEGICAAFAVFYLPGVKHDDQKAQHLTAVVRVLDFLQSFNQPFIFCFPHSHLLSYMIFFLAFTGFVDKVQIFTLVF